MKNLETKLELLTPANLDFIKQCFDDFPEGVTIYDVHTTILYYNRAQGIIDDLAPEEALGKTLLDIYRVGDNTSYPSLRCLFSRKPVVDYHCYYHTHLGKLINSIHNIFPLHQSGRLTGCICFIREYGQIASQFQASTNPPPKPDAVSPPKPSYSFDQIITQDPEFRKSLDVAALAADTPSPVLLHGETGCGKEMFAQAIHEASPRRDKSFVAINCAAIPESLLEGIIFGTVKGAFTGALDKAGMMEMAHGGSIFFDEINSMPLGLQSKMLRAVQESRIRRVGGAREIAVDLKIISASNVPPRKAVTDGSLRADLLFRLGVVIVGIPPLRERRGDISLLIKYFIGKFNQRLDKKIECLDPEVEKIFCRYSWPGNVRELEHALEGAMNLAQPRERFLEARHFNSSLIGEHLREGDPAAPFPGSSALEPPPSLPSGADTSLKETARQNEINILLSALVAAGGNAAKAARQLNISPQLMNYKIKKFGLKKKLIVRME
jgi:arginine utilization regulatory protein